MTKNKRTILLVTAVLLIYGAVIARFFLLQSHDSNTILLATEGVNFNPKTYEEIETFTIKNNYPDPFLGEVPKKKVKSPSIKKKLNPLVEEPFPPVRYLGIVSDGNGKNKIFSVEILGVQYVTRAGDSHKEVKIISGDRDEINVVWKNKKKTIRL